MTPSQYHADALLPDNDFQDHRDHLLLIVLGGHHDSKQAIHQAMQPLAFLEFAPPH